MNPRWWNEVLVLLHILVKISVIDPAEERDLTSDIRLDENMILLKQNMLAFHNILDIVKSVWLIWRRFWFAKSAVKLSMLFTFSTLTMKWWTFRKFGHI